jgi:hypothetical protein
MGTTHEISLVSCCETEMPLFFSLPRLCFFYFQAPMEVQDQELRAPFLVVEMNPEHGLTRMEIFGFLEAMVMMSILISVSFFFDFDFE